MFIPNLTNILSKVMTNHITITYQNPKSGKTDIALIPQDVTSVEVHLPNHPTLPPIRVTVNTEGIIVKDAIGQIGTLHYRELTGVKK